MLSQERGTLTHSPQQAQCATSRNSTSKAHTAHIPVSAGHLPAGNRQDSNQCKTTADGPAITYGMRLLATCRHWLVVGSQTAGHGFVKDAYVSRPAQGCCTARSNQPPGPTCHRRAGHDALPRSRQQPRPGRQLLSGRCRWPARCLSRGPAPAIDRRTAQHRDHSVAGQGPFRGGNLAKGHTRPCTFVLLDSLKVPVQYQPLAAVLTHDAAGLHMYGTLHQPLHVAAAGI
jgi:hypothetical protein